MTRLVFNRLNMSEYEISLFTERHNHTVLSESYKPFMKANRTLDVVHQNFILDYHIVNVGATKSYKLFKEIVGGYDNVWCSVVDFNFFFARFEDIYSIWRCTDDA